MIGALNYYRLMLDDQKIKYTLKEEGDSTEIEVMKYPGQSDDVEGYTGFSCVHTFDTKTGSLRKIAIWE